MKYFKFKTDKQGVATLTFDMPKSSVNVLSSAVLDALEKQLDKCFKDQNIKALFIESAKKDIFIAGADIKEIEQAKEQTVIDRFIAKGQEIFNKLEKLPFPTIAVINGACLGGGLELALSCDYRIATSHAHTRIGFPEVNLGILPGFGGTQRLSSLVGYAKAMELILGAKQLKGEKALKLGLVDACVPDGYLGFKKAELVETIIATKAENEIKSRRKGIVWYERLSPVRYLIATMAKKKVLAKTHGHYPAPLKVIEVMQESYGKPLDEGLKIEREAERELVMTDVSRNLIRLFLVSEQLKSETFSTKAPKEIHHAAIVGTGTMGSAIAWALDNQDIDVRLKVRKSVSAAKAISKIRKIYEGYVKRGRLTEREIALKMDKITFSVMYEGFEESDFLLEAISEDKALKQKIYKEFEAVLRPDTIIATNTSSISISALAENLVQPDRFVGMHFFNPVNRMPLVEIIPGEKTTDETIATVVQLSKQMGKTPIKVKESAGFLVNRILMPYLNEAAMLFEEGTDIELIDQTLLSFGMPMGPLRLVDEVGVDIGEKVSAILYQAYGERMHPVETLKSMVDHGWFGKKSGLGFYNYEYKTPVVNQKIKPLQKNHTSLDKDMILDRTVLIMINEAARCLEEHVVDNSGYLDMAMVMGTGFPAFRGGLLRYADQLGVDFIITRLNQFRAAYSQRFAPTDLLLQMAQKKQTFYGGVS